MNVITLLEQAQGGRLFAAVAESVDLDEAQTRRAMGKLCPAIAAQLHARAAEDEDLFQSLLELIEDGGSTSLLDDHDALTSQESISDGNAILDDVYGSRSAAMAALRKADETIPERELAKLAPISATAVVAALAQANRPLALKDGEPQQLAGGSGVLGTLVTAIVSGAVTALSRQLGSGTRRRSTSYSRTRSSRKAASRTRATRRRRNTTASVEDIFRDILGNLGK